MQLTRTPRPRIRSAYTRQHPPPYEAPTGIPEVMAWQLAASQWREHLPDDLLGVDCVTCRIAWPCDAWDIANDVINDCRDTAAEEKPIYRADALDAGRPALSAGAGATTPILGLDLMPADTQAVIPHPSGPADDDQGGAIESE